MRTAITTMIMTIMIMNMGMIITMDTATVIRTVMAIAIPIRTVGMITTITIRTIMTMTTIMITTTMIMCITRMARRITARALPACMYPA